MARLRFSMAHEVLDSFEPARADIGPDLPDAEPLRYLDALAAGPAPEAALSFLAYLLPRREAVWWGCRCLRGAEAALPENDAALAIAERWVARPDDGVRRTALATGLEGDLSRPSQWMAVAAGWAGGSMALGDYAVPAKPHLTARAIRAGLLLLLAGEAPDRRAEAARRCAVLGRRIASGDDAL